MKQIVLAALLAATLAFSAVPVVAAEETASSEQTEYSQPVEEETENYPKISGADPINGGFKLSWEAFEGAASYLVLAKTNELDWAELGLTEDLYITHTGLESNSVYTYTVVAVDENGEYIGDYNAQGMSYKYLDVPALTSIESVYGGVKIKWNKVEGAQSYRIYVKDGDEWKALATTQSSSFVDSTAVSGKSYTYTVECVSSEDESAQSFYDENGISITYFAAPVVKKTENTAKGTKVSWSKVEGAKAYRLYSKSNGSQWKKVGDTSALSLEHTGLKNNTSYSYTVRCLDENGNLISGYDSQGKTNKFLSVPSISSVTSAYGGMKISWQKVSGAVNYGVYVKNGSSWKKLGTTSSTSYLDKSVKSNKSYTYTIRCLSKDGESFESYYNTSGKSGKYVAAPKITELYNVKDGTRVTWSKSEGASKYRLFVKENGKWKGLGNTTDLSMTHTGLKNNTNYTYTVRALDSKGNYISGYNSDGWTKKFLSVPTINSVESVYSGMKVSWKKVSGAENYRVYVKSGSKWQKLGDTTSTSYVDKNVSSGKSYTYTVRCMSKDGKTFASYYSTKGKSGTYVAAPKISKFENTANGTKVSWNKVSGASKYRLYYKSGNEWKRIGETSSQSLTHSSLKSNTSYTYTVRALDSKGNFVSGFNSKGWANRFIAPPSFSSISKTDKGMVLKWKAVSNVSAYRVYRKNFGGSWKKTADVNSTSYTDSAYPKNTPYTYTLRCLDDKGNTISYYKSDTKYYYNGSLASGKINYNGSSYYFKDGLLTQGYVKINGNTYYYNSSGVLQKNGVVGTKKEGYCYADKNGKIDYGFTGIAKNSEGYWYCIKGKVDLTYRNGVTYNGSDWIVENGKARKVTSEKDKTYFRAMKIVYKITDKSMSKSEKLKVCFDYVKKTYTELNPRIPHYKGMDWPVIYANDMFIDGAGNCLSYAAAFGFMAKAIGYENVYGCHSGGHGWTEIDGLIYDPEWSRHYFDSTYYGISYNTKTSNNYKAAIAPGYAWMHVKI